MSTKIWEAYKLQDGTQFWKLVADIKRKATSNVKKEIAKIIDNCANAIDPKDLEDRSRGSYLTPEKIKLNFAREKVYKWYKEASISPYKDLFNFDVSVAFREHLGSIYIIPYYDSCMKNVLKFLKNDKRLVDYHYQNQTDMPEEVSLSEWKEREKVWNKLCEPNKWENMVALDICKFDMCFNLIFPYEI